MLTSMPAIINISTILSAPFLDAKIDYFYLFLIYFNSILYEPQCNAVSPYSSAKLIITKSEMIKIYKFSFL